MWVIRRENRINQRGVVTDVYEVGFYDPAAMWCCIEAFDALHRAMRMTNYLNGGGGTDPPFYRAPIYDEVEEDDRDLVEEDYEEEPMEDPPPPRPSRPPRVYRRR